ncbi:MAG: flagellar hook-associated protein FlgK [Hyphomicrobiales bacterium]
MGLSSALSMALSGLNANQRGLQLAATNVANADTPGYSAKTQAQSVRVGDGRVIGLEAGRIQRSLDQAVQTQLRSESGSAAYADRVSSYQSRMDELLGTPGSNNALDTLFNNFTSALEGLSTTPESFVTRSEALSNGRVLASQLNGLSADIQSMRQENEDFLRQGVNEINTALQNVKRLNDQILSEAHNASGTADLQDQRDIYIDEISHYMDVRVTEDEQGGVRLATTGGALLFDRVPASLSFDARGTITPQTEYSINPDERGVGTISMTSVSGLQVDLLQPGLLRDGALAAARDLRDDVLVEAQAQLDQFAGAMAAALGNRPESGTAVTSGAASGYDLDLSGVQPGNSFSLSFTSNSNGQTQTVSFVRVDDSSKLPLDDGTTGRSDDRVVGLDYSAGAQPITTQIQAALGVSFSVFDQGGDVVRVLDDGASNAVTINSFDASVSTTSLTDDGVALPFFTDVGGKAFTNSLDDIPQAKGFAGRISVNENLIEDNSRLVVYETGPDTLDGDSTRPEFLFDALTQSINSFTDQGGIGTSSAPFSGTVSSFVSQIISVRGAAAQDAQRTADSQRSVVEVLENRFAESTEVSIDEEMARLVELQTAYAANARVMQVVQEMLATVLRI